MIGLLMMAATSVVTCPGGPLFVFQPGTARFTAEANDAIPHYVTNLKSELWRTGWITVSSTVINKADQAAIRLVDRRKRAILKRMARLGVDRTRIRFEVPNATYGNDSDHFDWIDVYPSTLNVSQGVWDRLVDPGMMC